MSRKSKMKYLAIAGCMAVVSASGCHQLDIESTFDASGAGVRRLTVTAESDPGDPISFEDYRTLMNLTEKRGWSHSTKKKEGSDSTTVHTFQLEEKPSALKAWANLSGDIHVIGSVKEEKYARIVFRNGIEVSAGVGPEIRTLTYRERFQWKGYAEALITYQIEAFRPVLERSYPRLTPEQIGEIFGFLRASFGYAVEKGLLTSGDSNRTQDFAETSRRVKANTMRIIHSRYPEADDTLVEEFLHGVFLDRNDTDEAFLDQHALGAILAASLDLVVRVKMPGSIVETNAHSRNGNTLEWKFTGEDAIAAPVELYARAEIPDDAGTGE